MDYIGESTEDWDIWIPEYGGNADKIDDNAKDAMKELASLVTFKDRDDYTITEYVNDITRENEEVLAELNPRGKITTAYTYGYTRESADSHGETQYYLYDGQNNVSRIASEWGRVKETYNYDPYGNLTYGIPDTVNYYGYNGESQNLATGLQYLRARYYNPHTGNFLTEDTYPGQISDPLSLNRYDYVSNNPVNYDDPSGHFAIPSWMKDGIDNMKDGVKDVVNTVKKGVESAVDTVKNAAKDVGDAIKDGWDKLTGKDNDKDKTPKKDKTDTGGKNDKSKTETGGKKDEKGDKDKKTPDAVNDVKKTSDNKENPIENAIRKHKAVSKLQQEAEEEVRQEFCEYLETDDGKEFAAYFTVSLVDLLLLGAMTYFSGGLTLPALVLSVVGGVSNAFAGIDESSTDSGGAIRDFAEDFSDGLIYGQILALIGEFAPKLATNPMSINMTEASLETLLDTVYAMKESGSVTLSSVLAIFIGNAVTDSDAVTKPLQKFLDNFKGVKNFDDFAEAIKKLTKGGAKSNNPSSFLEKALKNQGLDTTPSRLKEVWVEGDYKYTVRVHKGNSKYTDAESIYRVSRQSTVLDEHGQGTGLEYLGTDGNWYHESVLTEFFKDGTPNPNFNEAAAKMTHIPVSGGK